MKLDASTRAFLEEAVLDVHSYIAKTTLLKIIGSISGEPVEQCCDSNPFDPPATPICACTGCFGVLRSNGRNIKNTLTFLNCDVCKCTYAAQDKERPSGTLPR